MSEIRRKCDPEFREGAALVGTDHCHRLPVEEQERRRRTRLHRQRLPRSQPDEHDRQLRRLVKHDHAGTVQREANRALPPRPRRQPRPSSNSAAVDALPADVDLHLLAVDPGGIHRDRLDGRQVKHRAGAQVET